MMDDDRRKKARGARTLVAVPLDALDEVIALEPQSIRTIKHVRAEELYFAGHYPGNPIYPGIFIVEAVVQAVRAHLEASRRHGSLAEVVSTRFLAPVQPGDTLSVHCDLSPGEPAGEFTVKAA